ncbi:MAG: DUF5009 domain-containing protein [Cytophagaceae bacterium]|nr:DUF5009 domain-containing protein [Cytophagaceae bacterium]MDW8456126.1 DUF5009 domain-containing protein [Cytophagaceae bacterium]
MNKPERILSVDFLRGFTVAGMILVNNPGSWSHIYPPLRHATWNGCTPTDLVFPFFLFIVGVSLSYSLLAAKNDTSKRKKVYFKIIKRSFILFFLGLLLNGFPYYNLSEIRIPSVLGRIAIVFLCSAIIYVNTTKRTQIIITSMLLVLCYIGW